MTYRVTLRKKPPMIFKMVKIQQVNSIDDVLIEIWDGGDRSIDLILFQARCGVKLGPVFIWPDSAVSPVVGKSLTAFYLDFCSWVSIKSM